MKKPRKGALFTNRLAEMIEMEQSAKPQAAFGLLPFLESENWLERAKALIVLGRLQNPEIAPQMLAFLKSQKEPHWQLMALDSWHQLPLAREEKTKILQEVLLWATSPILVRGIISLCGYIGGKGVLMLLADFIEKPSHRLVKDEILAFAWFHTVKDLDSAFVERQLAGKENLRVWLKHQSHDAKAIYGIYPNPDYLWQCAKKAGISREEFKLLYWRPRKKALSCKDASTEK